MTGMKKIGLTALVLAMVVSLLAACSGRGSGDAAPGASSSALSSSSASSSSPSSSAESELGGRIVFLSHRTDYDSDGTYEEYARRFKEKYPNAEIEFETLTNYAQDIKVRITTGEAGDVLMIDPGINQSDLPKYFEPLPDSLFENAYFPDQRAWEGKRYGITTGVNTNGIVYNKRAFEKAGVEVPRTLDELYDAARKLKEAGIIPLYMNYGAQWPVGNWFEGAGWWISGDPKLHDKLVQSDTPFTMDGPFAKAIQIARTFVENGWVEPDLSTNNWEMSKGEVASGKAAMYFLGNWVIPQVIGAGAAPEDIGFFPFPHDNSGTVNAVLGPDYFMGVSKDSKNIEAAKAFVKFFVMDSGYDADSGFIPINKNNEPTLPQMAEFMSYNPNVLESVPSDSRFNEIANKAQIPFTGEEIQQMAVAKDLKAEFDKLNQKWAAAKKELGY